MLFNLVKMQKSKQGMQMTGSRGRMAREMTWNDKMDVRERSCIAFCSIFKKI